MLKDPIEIIQRFFVVLLFNYFLLYWVAGKDYETSHLHSYWRIEGNVDACGHSERNTSSGTAWHPAIETRDLTHLDYHVRNVRGGEGQGDGNAFLRTITIQTRLIPRISYLPTRWIKSHYIAQEKSSACYFFNFMAAAVSFSFSLFPLTYFSRGGGFRANGCIFTKATCTRCLPTCGLSSLPVIHYGWPPRLWHINFTCFRWSRTYRMIHERRVKKVLSHEIEVRVNYRCS